VTQLCGFRIEKRDEVSPWVRMAAILTALGGAFLLCAALIASARADVGVALGAIGLGALGTWPAFCDTLVKATPLILTGLAATVAFRARVWNIGGEGQLFAGAMAAYWVSATFKGLPTPLYFILILGAAFAAGAACGLIPGWLKGRLGVDEIIVTVLMNYVVVYLFSFMLSDPWRDPRSYYLQSSAIPDAAQFPIVFAHTRLHAGFLVAVSMAVAAYIMLQKTPLGYEIRALGHNPRASQFKGIDVHRLVIVIMMISGGLAGLAGAGELAGVHYRLRLDISADYGFTGIIIAMLAQLNPLGVILAGILFGGLSNGAFRMQVVTGVPVALVYAIQGIVLVFLLVAEALTRYRVRRV